MNRVATMGRKKITHVLFDYDGTLIDSIDKIQIVLGKMVAEKGKKLTPTIIEYIPNLTSMRSLSEFVNRELNLDYDHTEFRAQIFKNILRSNLQLMPGVEKLVIHLHRHQIPMAVATGNVRKYYDSSSQLFGDFFSKYFRHCVCGDEVAKSKPNPDVFYTAAKQFNSPPESMENVLIFEDSITGLTGALASGAQTVFLGDMNSKIVNKNIDLVHKSNLILDDLDKFDPQQFGLPPY